MGPIQIDARVASVIDIHGDDTQKAVTFDLDLDGDHKDWNGADHPGFSFAVNVRADVAAELKTGAPVAITIEPA